MRIFFKIFFLFRSLFFFRKFCVMRWWMPLQIAFVMCLSALAYGQAEKVDADFSSLLKEAEQSAGFDKRIDSEREKNFIKNKHQQQKLLSEAKEKALKLEGISEKLEQEFFVNEQEVAQSYGKLLLALGSLKEIFGHVSVSASDVRDVFKTSPVSAQLSERNKRLEGLINTLDQNTQLPSAEQLELLWLSMMGELEASAEVSRFTTQLLQANGERIEIQATRFGNFNLLHDEQYLSYSSELNGVAMLPGQPSVNNRVHDLHTLVDDDFSVIHVDPTGPLGGSYLQVLVQTPSLLERWRQGGVIGLVITLLGLVSFLLSVWRFTDLERQLRRVNAQFELWQLEGKLSTDNNVLTQVLSIYESDPQVNVETLERRLGEKIISLRPSLERFIPLLKIVSVIAPLLGLLGTVSGMILTFQAITSFGTGDPKTMAGGISSALVTTVLGLLVAIPMVFIHSALSQKANGILQILKQQSAGLIALNSENQQ